MMKIIKNIFLSKEFKMGLGIGLILSSLLLWNKSDLSDEEIELRAKELGMKYEWEVKAGEVNVDD